MTNSVAVSIVSEASPRSTAGAGASRKSVYRRVTIRANFA